MKKNWTILFIYFIFLLNLMSQVQPFQILEYSGNKINEYDTSLAYFCAKISQYTYMGHEKKLEEYYQKYNFCPAKKPVQNRLLKLKYSVASRLLTKKNGQKANLVLIAFAGTQQVKDIITNAMIKPSTLKDNINVHSGFWKYTKAFCKDESQIMVNDHLHNRYRSLQDMIENDSSSQTIFLITGHSLGGAVATLYRVSLYERNTSAVIYTFASPGVGDHNFVHLYNEAFPLHRVIIKYDIVPMSTSLENEICDAVRIKKHPMLEVISEITLKILISKIREHKKVKRYTYYHIGTPHIYGKEVNSRTITEKMMIEFHKIEKYVAELEK